MNRSEIARLKVGDTVEFKSDVEQYGEIISKRGNQATLKSPWLEGFSGSYIGGDDETTVDLRDCWVD